MPVDMAVGRFCASHDRLFLDSKLYRSLDKGWGYQSIPGLVHAPSRCVFSGMRCASGISYPVDHKQEENKKKAPFDGNQHRYSNGDK